MSEGNVPGLTILAVQCGHIVAFSFLRLDPTQRWKNRFIDAVQPLLSGLVTHQPRQTFGRVCGTVPDVSPPSCSNRYHQD